MRGNNATQNKCPIKIAKSISSETKTSLIDHLLFEDNEANLEVIERIESERAYLDSCKRGVRRINFIQR